MSKIPPPSESSPCPRMFMLLHILNIIYLVWLKNKDPLDKALKSMDDDHAEVLWIALHKNFDKKTRNYNIAVVGLTYPLQFHAHLYQICLPDTGSIDSNAGT